MIEVQLLRQADKAVEEFKRVYEERYGRGPVLGDSKELQLFLRDLIKQVGEERAIELVRFYIQNDGHLRWWVGKGHSVKVFKQEIEAINATCSIAKHNPPSAKNIGPDPVLDFETQCPGCKQWFVVRCHVSEMPDIAYTRFCGACKAMHTINFQSRCPKCKSWFTLTCSGDKAEELDYRTNCQTCRE